MHLFRRNFLLAFITIALTGALFVKESESAQEIGVGSGKQARCDENDTNCQIIRKSKIFSSLAGRDRSNDSSVEVPERKKDAVRSYGRYTRALKTYEIILIVLGGLVGVALCIAVLVYYKLF